MPKLKHDPRSGGSYKLSPKSIGTRRRESLEGSPWPLGVTWVEAEQAYNFALYSQHASRVRLLIYEAERLVEPVFVYEFDQFRNKTGAVWHARIPRAQAGTAAYYAYSVDGPTLSGEALKLRMFNSAKILLDPYARQVFFPANFERSAALSADTNAGRALLGVLDGGTDSFDWSGDSTPRHEHDLVIYEMHVRGFTMNSNSEVDSQNRGTFAGVIEKIPYLQELGITAVELMPVFEFDDTEPNYWGYMPISFFAPHHRYAGSRDGAAAVREFQEMVKALHQAEIEVILDVVYNHTGEGNEHGPVFGLKGIDAATYYMSSSDPSRTYADFTGAGNTLNCAHPAARQLIVHSLRHWVREMHVDGFRFDLASVFSRNSDGTINFEEPPIFGDIAADPDLARVRLIAEPWEGNAQYPNYELGQSPWVYGRESKACCEKPACPCPPTWAILQRSFPGAGWKQWNDKFRNTVRRFVKSDSGLVADLMTRIYGSSDVFPDSIESSCRPHQSLNYIASHDGPTLYDLVAYDSDDSWNCGNRDGEESVGDEVSRLRKQQVKNFCCLLLLSNGTPMFRAGDEFLQTQFGHRNPWNVDGPTTSLDWDRLETHEDIFRFFQKMIAFRKAHPSIARSVFWRNDVRWYGVGAQPDLSYDSHTLAYCLHGGSEDDDLYVMINAYWEPLDFAIQEGQPDQWRKVVDTAANPPEDFCEAASAEPLRSPNCAVPARSVVMLLRGRWRPEVRAKREEGR
jgi:isoamylase